MTVSGAPCPRPVQYPRIVSASWAPGCRSAVDDEEGDAAHAELLRVCLVGSHSAANASLSSTSRTATGSRRPLRQQHQGVVLANRLASVK